MDDFEQRLDKLDTRGLSRLLEGSKEPVRENELLKFLFPGISILNVSPLELYQAHFLLFHALYGMQDAYHGKGLHLHIHFAGTVLREVPGEGSCRYFEDRFLGFCGAGTVQGSPYCEFHRDKLGESGLEELSIKYFYLDGANYYKLDENTAEAFMNGTWELLKGYGEYKKSFQVLGLPETSDIGMIKKKYRKLARIHHPDAAGGNPPKDRALEKEAGEKFLEINRAYRLLMRLAPMFGGF